MKRSAFVQKLKQRPCEDCGKTIIKRNSMEKYCPACRAAKMRAERIRPDADVVTVAVSKLPEVKRYKKAGAIFRSEPYLAAVRSLLCVKCGIARLTEAAHSNQLRFGKGRSVKASDATAMALCKTIPGRVGCHALHDQGGKLSKAEWQAFEYWAITMTVVALILQGKLAGYDGALMSIPETTDHEDAAVFLVGLIESGQLRVAQ
jgi:predicted RNA-binding Zn-ribbon protein involved in translation (DUF1610 family)